MPSLSRFHWSGELRIAGVFGEDDLLDQQSVGPTYGITGVVTAAGSPVVSCVVRLYSNSNGALVESTTTDGSGVYSFTDLSPTPESYFVLAFDPAGGTVYNIGRLALLTAGS